MQSSSQSGSATHVMKEVLGKANKQIENIEETVQDVVEQARARVEPTLEEVQTAWADTVRYTKKYPAKALGFAALAGLAVGALITLFSSRD